MDARDRLTGAAPMRLELVLLSLSLVCWTLGLLGLLRLVSLAGMLDLGLYGYYSVAAAAGWIAGNVYLLRARGFPREMRRRLLLVYFLGPPGVLLLVRVMASLEAQLAAPIVPTYGFGVFAIFFLVPVSLKGSAMRRTER